MAEGDHDIQSVIAYTERQIARVDGSHIHQTLALQRNDIHLSDTGRLVSRIGRFLVEVRISIVDIHSGELKGECVMAWEERERSRPGVGLPIN